MKSTFHDRAKALGHPIEALENGEEIISTIKVDDIDCLRTLLLDGAPPEARQERAEAMLERVGLSHALNRYPSELSGGMQQRASICRALIHEPKMLLLDEPFGALDAFTREELWCALRDLQAQQKFNVILVTHDLREAVFLADTVYVMSKSPGRILTRRDIELPRPRDLDVTYTPEFTGIVHELRAHIGAIRKPATTPSNTEIAQ